MSLYSVVFQRPGKKEVRDLAKQKSFEIPKEYLKVIKPDYFWFNPLETHPSENYY